MLVVIALDDYLGKLPPAWVRVGDHVGAHAEEGIVFELVDGEIERRLGPVGAQVIAAYRGAVGRAVRARPQRDRRRGLASKTNRTK